jgi:pimeloyl-ACP methyl ester carboxylesterase
MRETTGPRGSRGQQPCRSSRGRASWGTSRTWASCGGRSWAGAVGSVRGDWPGHATERYVGPWNAKTKTPILLISNRFDPATGYCNAQVAQRRLGNAVLLTENGFGHQSPQ